MSARAWGTLIVLVTLVIGGSIYFLQSGSPRPRTYDEIGVELGGDRIERTSAGFALTAPPGWRAWEPTRRFQDWWGSDQVVSLWLEPDSDAETWWIGTCENAEQCTRERMVEAGGEAYCWVTDDTDVAAESGWSGSAMPAALTASRIAEQEWTDVSTVVEELPGGETSTVRAVDPNGWAQTIFHLTDGERWHRLICGVIDSDVDPRTIAESFEFLPVGD